MTNHCVKSGHDKHELHLMLKLSAMLLIYIIKCVNQLRIEATTNNFFSNSL